MDSLQTFGESIQPFLQMEVCLKLSGLQISNLAFLIGHLEFNHYVNCLCN